MKVSYYVSHLCRKDSYVEKVLVSLNAREHFANFKKDDLKNFYLKAPRCSMRGALSFLALQATKGRAAAWLDQEPLKCRSLAWLHAHTWCSSEGCNNRCCDWCNHLYDEFNGFFLCHGTLINKVNTSLSSRAFPPPCHLERSREISFWDRRSLHALRLVEMTSVLTRRFLVKLKQSLYCLYLKCHKLFKF